MRDSLLMYLDFFNCVFTPPVAHVHLLEFILLGGGQEGKRGRRTV